MQMFQIDTTPVGRALKPIRSSKKTRRTKPGTSSNEIITPHCTIGIELNFDSDQDSGEMDTLDAEADDTGAEENIFTRLVDENALNAFPGMSDNDAFDCAPVSRVFSEFDSVYDMDEDPLIHLAYDIAAKALVVHAVPERAYLLIAIDLSPFSDDHPLCMLFNELLWSAIVTLHVEIERQKIIAHKIAKSWHPDEDYADTFSDRPRAHKRSTFCPQNRKIVRTRDPWGNIVAETSETELRRMRRDAKSWDALDHEPTLTEIKASLRNIFELWHFDLPPKVEAWLLETEEYAIWTEVEHGPAQAELDVLETAFIDMYNWRDSFDDRTWTDPEIDRITREMFWELWELEQLDVYRHFLNGPIEHNSGFAEESVYTQLSAKVRYESEQQERFERLLEDIDAVGGKRPWHWNMNPSTVSNVVARKSGDIPDRFRVYGKVA